MVICCGVIRLKELRFMKMLLFVGLVVVML